MKFHAFSLEPVAQFLDVFPIGVVEMAIGGEKLYSLCATAFHGIKQPRMQALLM